MRHEFNDRSSGCVARRQSLKATIYAPRTHKPGVWTKPDGRENGAPTKNGERPTLPIFRPYLRPLDIGPHAYRSFALQHGPALSPQAIKARTLGSLQ